MNILLISYKYYPFVGGIETQVRLLANELATRHRVRVAAPRFQGHSLHRLIDLEDSVLLPGSADFLDGVVPVHSLAPTSPERMRMGPIALRSVPVVRRFFGLSLRRFGYRFYRSVYVPRIRQLARGSDVVHSFAWDYLGWAAQDAAAAEGIPFVVSTYVHPGQWGDDPENISYYNRADAVLALLETDREKLVALGTKPDLIRLSGVVPVLPFDSDPSGFRARHNLGNSPIVLFIGRLEEYKGPRAMLHAAPAIWRERPDVHLLFAGPPRDESIAWFDEMNDPRARYFGVISEQEKADAMAACDLFCMPSTGEILPAVYLEAWSYAKPVIGGTAHGLKALIEDNGGGLIVDQHPENIAARILELLGDAPRRRAMGQRGRELVERRFSRQALLGVLESTYSDVIATRSRHADEPEPYDARSPSARP